MKLDKQALLLTYSANLGEEQGPRRVHASARKCDGGPHGFGNDLVTRPSSLLFGLRLHLGCLSLRGLGLGEPGVESEGGRAHPTTGWRGARVRSRTRSR